MITLLRAEPGDPSLLQRQHNPTPAPPRPAVMLTAHVALGGMLGAGLGAFDTAFWLTLSTQWVGVHGSWSQHMQGLMPSNTPALARGAATALTASAQDPRHMCSLASPNMQLRHLVSRL